MRSAPAALSDRENRHRLKAVLLCVRERVSPRSRVGQHDTRRGGRVACPLIFVTSANTCGKSQNIYDERKIFVESHKYT